MFPELSVNRFTSIQGRQTKRNEIIIENVIGYAIISSIASL